MNFIEYIQSEAGLTEWSLEQFKAIIKRKTYAKRDLILPSDNRSKQIYFIEEGAARVFYLRPAKEVTLYFLNENKIGLPVDSIFYDEICKFGIEALTETKAAIIHYPQWDAIMKRDPALQRLSFRLMVDYIKKANDRLYNLKFQTPLDRYRALLAEFPSLEQHAPLGHIASYLGITQETLSRLRAMRI